MQPPTSRVRKLKPREVKRVARGHVVTPAVGWVSRNQRALCSLASRILVWGLQLLPSSGYPWSRFLYVRFPHLHACSSSWMTLSGSGLWSQCHWKIVQSLTDLVPSPSHLRSQPSPSGRAVKIFSGYEPPSWTSLLFFKPKHQCCVHMHMSYKFFYSFHFQHSFYFQGVKGLFRVHKSLCTQWHFTLSGLPWDFFIFCRWSWVEKWLLNPAYSGDWLKSRSPHSLPTSTFVKILHNYWKQFKRSCLWSIKQDFLKREIKGLKRTHETEMAGFCLLYVRNYKNNTRTAN